MRHTAWAAVVVLPIAVAILVAPPAPAPRLAPTAAEAQSAFKYTGSASCAASNCHGNTKAKADYPKLNENIVWLQKDKHAKAYETLTNEKLKSKVSPSGIGKKLSIAKVDTSERCLSCHAVNVKAELRGPKFDVTDGVHCDGCHGPAEKWLEPHAEKGWTHEQSVKVGMYDTKNLLLRAEKCVSCHLQIEADLVTAGHPDLNAFELDTFSQEMSKPPHWRDRGTWFGARAWSIGQVVSLREAAKQLADRAKANVSPKLLGDAGKKVQGHGAVVRLLFTVVAPDAQKALEQDLASLADLVAKGDKAAIVTTAGKVVAAMNQQAPKIAARELDQATAQKLIQTLAAGGDAIGAAGLRAAEQGAMALDRLYAVYAKAPGNKPDKAVSAALDRVFGTLEDPAKYDAPKFAAEMKGFQQAFK